MIRVSSFDIFDTCLTRTYAFPTDLFDDLGARARARGWITLDPEAFRELRRKSERAARRLVPTGEIILDEIYAELGRRLGMDGTTLTELKNLELLLEEEALQPVPEAFLLIAEARGQGRHILFLSDMYLPSAFLQRLLMRHGFFEEGDVIHVSGERRASKGTAQLFHHARARLHAPAGHWSHLGDNLHADIKVPRRLGLSVEHFASATLNRFERLVTPRHRQREPWRSRLAGAMRLARLAKPAGLDAAQKTIWDTAADVVGPLFYGYVQWLLEEAVHRGISRVYFVARDGQILHRIAQVIQASRDLPVECRYLYGSRHAWLPASLREVDAFHLRWILSPTDGLSLRKIFERLQLAPEPHLDLLQSHGLPGDIDQALDAAQLERMAGVVQDSRLTSAIQSTCVEKRVRLLEYLRREGVFEQPEIAIIDLGWHGSLRKALAEVCAAAPGPGRPRVWGFHLALLDAPDRIPENDLGYINQADPPGIRRVLFYSQLLETFASADHGQALDYENGRPVLAARDNPVLTRWGLSSLQNGVLAFARTYTAGEKTTVTAREYLSASLAIMRLFYEQPTLAESQTWSSFPRSSRQIEGALETLVPSWTWMQTMRLLLTRDGRRRLWWPAALARKERKAAPFLFLYYQVQKIWRLHLRPL